MALKSKSRRKEPDDQEIQYNPLRDLEGNAFEKFVARAAYLLRSNVRMVLYGLVSLVVIFTSVVSYNIYDNIKEEQALLAYEKLQDNPLMQPGAGSLDAAIEKVDQYSSKYSTSGAKLRSSLKKLQLYQKAGKNKEAADEAAKIASGLKHAPLQVYFYLKAGNLYEKTEQYQRALDCFSAADNKLKKDSIPRALALFGKGRSLTAMGKKEEGKKAIEQMISIKDVDGIKDIQIAASSYLMKK